jgi:cytidylate kinase
VSIFINAPFEMRARRVMSTDELSYKEACKLLHKLDRQHRRYYEFYTGRKWGNSNNYDLCINSASYGIEGSVQLIERVINQHTRKKPENP